MSWDKDFERGKLKEVEVKEHFGKYFTVEHPDGKNQFDLFISGKIEVKFDRLAPQTTRYAIELRCNGTNSGLSITEAHSWVLCTYEGCWIVPTELLRYWVKEFCEKNGKWDLVSGGDRKASEMAMLPYSLVKQFWKIL